MCPASDLYKDVALIYTHLLSKESPEAAIAVERIHAAWGAHAALRAALILLTMKMEVQQHPWIPSVDLYVYLLRDYPEAQPLLKQAMICCLQRWAVPVPETDQWVGLTPTSVR